MCCQVVAMKHPVDKQDTNHMCIAITRDLACSAVAGLCIEYIASARWTTNVIGTHMQISQQVSHTLIEVHMCKAASMRMVCSVCCRSS